MNEVITAFSSVLVGFMAVSGIWAIQSYYEKQQER